jgi:hypothetical protein
MGRANRRTPRRISRITIPAPYRFEFANASEKFEDTRTIELALILLWRLRIDMQVHQA